MEAESTYITEIEDQLETARAEIIYWRNRALRADRENVNLRQDAQLVHLEQRITKLQRRDNDNRTIMRLIDICQENDVEIDYCGECGGVLPVHASDCKDGDA